MAAAEVEDPEFSKSLKVSSMEVEAVIRAVEPVLEVKDCSALAKALVVSESPSESTEMETK